MKKLVAFGSSPIGGNTDYPCIIAKTLGMEFEARVKTLTSNSKIARHILNYKHCQDTLILVSWTHITRSEFRTEFGWMSININNYKWGRRAVKFEQDWYKGPGQWEYTSFSTTLKEILLAQTYLKSNNVPYVFLFDNNEVVKSWLFDHPDDYLKSIIDMIDWDKFVLFDGQGFIPWCLENGHKGFNGNHVDTVAHQQAAEYVLSNWHLKSQMF